MSDIINAWAIEYFETPDGQQWRVYVEQDQTPTSPREDENIAQLLTASRDYVSPDHDATADTLGIMDKTSDYAPWTSRMRGLYMAMHPDIIAWAMLDQNERDGSLSLQTYASSHEIGDEMHSGVAYVTRQQWEYLMGDDYEGDHTPMAAIEAEVKDYNAYAQGEKCGFIVEYLQTWQALNPDGTLAGDKTTSTWETHESVWGFYETDDAMDEGRACLPDGAVKTK